MMELPIPLGHQTNVQPSSASGTWHPSQTTAKNNDEETSFDKEWRRHAQVDSDLAPSDRRASQCD